MCHLIFFKCKEFRFLKSPNYSSSIVTFADSICLLITLHTVSYLICSNTALNKKSEAKVIEVDTKKVLLKTNFCFMNKSFHRKKKNQGLTSSFLDYNIWNMSAYIFCTSIFENFLLCHGILKIDALVIKPYLIK